MQRPERSSYNSTDFLGWRKLKSLEISPKFQRRPVWSRDARSYFIETLLLGYPVPPLYLRVRQADEPPGASAEPYLRLQLRESRCPDHL